MSLNDAISKQGVSVSSRCHRRLRRCQFTPATIMLFPAAAVRGNNRGMASGGPRLQIEKREIGDRTVWTTLVPDTRSQSCSVEQKSGHLAISAGIGALPESLGRRVGRYQTETIQCVVGRVRTGQRGLRPDDTVLVRHRSNSRHIRPDAAASSRTRPRQRPNDNCRRRKVIKGIDNLGAIVSESGHRDRALWSETTVQIDGERRGLLALMDHEKITLNDLPPLPADSTAFAAVSFSLSNSMTTSWRPVERPEGCSAGSAAAV